MFDFFNPALLRDFVRADFTDRSPFPWVDFSGILTDEAWETLYEAYPPLSLFENHQGLERAHHQRPHDRYYLAYEQSIYHKGAKEAGVVHHNELPEAWQAFLTELQTSEMYRTFIADLLQTRNLAPRFAWHVGREGSEVSPHRDADDKIGTHIFYFNTKNDWEMEWGGATLALSGKKTPLMNPDFSDFENEAASEIRDNHSFLFKNTPDAWHGVRALTCPPEKYRRLFNVIFHEAAPKAAPVGGIGGKLRSVFGKK